MNLELRLFLYFELKIKQCEDLVGLQLALKALVVSFRLYFCIEWIPISPILDSKLPTCLILQSSIILLILVFSFRWSAMYSSTPQRFRSGMVSLVSSMTSRYLKSSWPSQMASISSIRLEIQTSRQMLRLGSIALFSDLSLKISDSRFLCIKKYARLNQKQHQISKSTRLYIQAKKTSLVNSFKASSHSDRLVFSFILRIRQMMKYSYSLNFTIMSKSFWQQLSARSYCEFMEQKNVPKQISIMWILGGYFSDMQASKLAASKAESPLFLNTLQQKSMNRSRSKPAPVSTRSLVLTFSTAKAASRSSIRCESWRCRAIIKHLIQAVIRCLSFLGILSSCWTTSSLFFCRLFRESRRLMFAIETERFIVSCFFVGQFQVIVAKAGRFRWVFGEGFWVGVEFYFRVGSVQGSIIVIVRRINKVLLSNTEANNIQTINPATSNADTNPHRTQQPFPSSSAR